MNAHDRDLTGKANDIAVVHYGDGEIAVLKPGRFVICAVSGKRIPLEALRYWNPTLQEAYAGPTEALARWKELNGRS
ncbi:MAG TPA: DUF2093 domain-containing protein [Caulobacteraceae bacterium]|nr:DUF2093 domain-containing protein [Caulobacteraceae bacterium]